MNIMKKYQLKRHSKKSKKTQKTKHKKKTKENGELITKIVKKEINNDY